MVEVLLGDCFSCFAREVYAANLDLLYDALDCMTPLHCELLQLRNMRS